MVKKDPLEVALHSHYSRMRNYHIKKHGGTEDDFIDYDSFREMILADCWYCGAEATLELKDRNHNVIGYRNTIDRVDSNFGYIRDNCVPCCPICNHAKKNLPLIDWFRNIKHIYEYSGLNTFDGRSLITCGDIIK